MKKLSKFNNNLKKIGKSKKLKKTKVLKMNLMMKMRKVNLK